MRANKQMKADCLSCDIVNGRKVLVGGTILETDSFHAHQDVAYPIPGMVILASKRHLLCLDELSDSEVEEWARVLHLLRSAQRAVLGVDHVYYFYNEDTRHHFHTWMMPRYQWMSELGRSVQSVRPILRRSADETVRALDTKAVEQAAADLRKYVAMKYGA